MTAQPPMDNPTKTDVGEIVERLNEEIEFQRDCFRARSNYPMCPGLLEQAATLLTSQQSEITRLTQEVEAAREALEPFASFADGNVDDEGWSGIEQRASIRTWFGPSDFRKARATLTGHPTKEPGNAD